MLQCFRALAIVSEGRCENMGANLQKPTSHISANQPSIALAMTSADAFWLACEKISLSPAGAMQSISRSTEEMMASTAVAQAL